MRIILDLGSALAVALLFVFASVSYTLMARRGEYGILRIVGFADGRLILSMLSEVMALGAASAPISTPD